MSDKPSDRVVVIILNWNGWSETQRCLDSVMISTASLVWVVDNGSEIDRSVELLANHPNLRLVRFSKNWGWAGGYNRALKIAAAEGAEFAYLLNNDTLVSKGFLSSALEPMTNNRHLAAVGSLILYAEDLGHWVKFDGNYYSFHQKRYDQTTYPPLLSAKEVNGAGMLVRLAALKSDGFFDERFFCYGEEREWCRRMLTHGWNMAVSSASVVLHHGESSDVAANARYYRARNRFLMQQTITNSLSLLQKWNLIRSLAGEAMEEARMGRSQGYGAVVEALRDGSLGNWGPRGHHRAGLGWRLFVALYGLSRTLAARLQLRKQLCRISLGGRTKSITPHGPR
jgi:GT2 family glycosyltransferase